MSRDYFIIGVCVGVIAAGVFVFLLHAAAWLAALIAFLILIIMLARIGFKRWRRGSWI